MGLLKWVRRSVMRRSSAEIPSSREVLFLSKVETQRLSTYLNPTVEDYDNVDHNSHDSLLGHECDMENVMLHTDAKLAVSEDGGESTEEEEEDEDVKEEEKAAAAAAADWRNSVLKTNPLFSDATLPKKSTRMSTLRSFFEQEMRRRSSSPLPASPDSSGSSPQLDDGAGEEDEEDAIREFTEEQERVLELSVVPPPLPRRGVNPRTGSITGGLNPSPSTPLSKHQGGGRFSLQYSATEQQRAIQLAKRKSLTMAHASAYENWMAATSSKRPLLAPAEPNMYDQPADTLTQCWY